jgi:hypothetical protein
MGCSCRMNLVGTLFVSPRALKIDPFVMAITSGWRRVTVQMGSVRVACRALGQRRVQP